MEGKQLTKDQQVAMRSLQSFCSSQNKFFRLTGYAGTGKSFLMCRFIKWLQDSGITFVAACPTNKAAKSLRNLAEEERLSMEVKTVAQLLGQQPQLNEETGKEEFLSNGDIDLSSHNIVIIDEFSMISKSNFLEITNAANCSLLTKIVFVGDSAQLPAINEPEPIVATSEIIDAEAVLSEVVRYDGDIARVCEKIRSNRAYSYRLYPFTTTPDETIVCLPHREWISTAIELFDSPEYQGNYDLVRFLAWRNRTVASLNKCVRDRLWGKDVLPYVVGDRLIARKPLFRTKPGAKGRDKWRILINNSEEATVVKPPVLKELAFQRQIFQYWSVEVQPDEGNKPIPLSILHEGFKELHTDEVRLLAKNRQWNDYFDLSRMFDDVTHAYALTTHKAQGSTIDYVFLDINDIKGCGDRQKLLYTALTRTRKQAFVIN